jgi:transcriptional regulator with XRE-family HTH domain
LASALIKARNKADMTQEEVAKAMGTTQAVVAQLESGKTLPSTRTLERFAQATCTRLRISFEPYREPAHSSDRWDQRIYDPVTAGIDRWTIHQAGLRKSFSYDIPWILEM